MNRFKDKHVLVTGAGTGIGKAIALRLGEEGALVSVVSRSKERLLKTTSEIHNGGGRACAHTADISSKDQINSTVEKNSPEHMEHCMLWLPTAVLEVQILPMKTIAF